MEYRLEENQLSARLNGLKRAQPRRIYVSVIFFPDH